MGTAPGEAGCGKELREGGLERGLLPAGGNRCPPPGLLNGWDGSDCVGKAKSDLDRA